MKTKIILCTGGARSGKSAFAEELALAQDGQQLYIATAMVYDDEMAERVVRHQERRGPQWKSIEAPKNMAARWKEIAAEGDVVLIDCLTMYVTNYLMDYPNLMQESVRTALRDTVLEEITALLDAIQATPGKTVIFVTNELGLGIVPADMMTRVFRDIAGEVNQYVAARADEVYVTISGITIEIKSREVTHG